ncbi:MAG: hypothetical protein KDL87_09660 [Verrucomicrobiae bacterium]|nr:hypothetical protein [Verrucomicrobiae bacterium]
MSEESDEAAAQAIAVQQLTAEVRALWRIVLSLLTLALVLLSLLSLEAYFSIPYFVKIFESVIPGRPLPLMTQLTFKLGDSPIALIFFTIGPVASMIWLWLERSRPGIPVFVMLCLCVVLGLFAVLAWMSLTLPLLCLQAGLGGV